MGVSSKIKSILEQEYEIKMISRINNYPNIDIKKDNLKDICILLHNNISVNSIKEYFKWTRKEFLERINILKDEDLIMEKDKDYKPNLMIISLEEFEYIYETLDNIPYEILSLIEKNRNLIESKTLEMKCFKPFDFKKLSLFILSDVILDFIQIDNVESLLLKKDRTKHGDKFYYYSLQQKKQGDDREALGIYGNQLTTYGNNTFGIYGNERDRKNFNTINSNYINENFLFLNNDYKNEKEFKIHLLNELVKYFKIDSYDLSDSILGGFNSLGIMDGKNICIPIINKNEFYELREIADIIKDKYINILEKYKSTIYDYYFNSIYLSEISFEEYFIWWYHILYSRVTDLLINQGEIVVPKQTNFSYLITD